MSDLFRYAIGLESMLLDMTGINAGNFPPHNIERLTEHHYIVTLALAGFTPDDLSVSVHRGVLRVAGAKTETNNKTVMPVDRQVSEDVGGGVIKELVEVQSEYLYQGIAYRDFVREFRIGDNVEVKSATMRDGLLIISLERQAAPEGVPIKIKVQ